jgi:hypothetical protein
MRSSLLVSLLTLVSLLLPRSVRAEGPLAQRLAQVRALYSAKPGGFDKIFAPSFLKAVPPDKLAPPLREYHKKGGPVISVLKVSSHGPYQAEYRFYTRTTVFPVRLTVSSSAPHLVTGMWFGRQSPRFDKLEQVTKALRALPGRVSYAVCQLGGKTPRPLAALDPELQLALGSTFKLYVLGALFRSKRALHQVVRLRDEWRSWPSGMLQDWPAGTPVTLATLADLMISISDNTATDHLLHTLGRRAVEGMLKTMGHAEPARDVPFLSTREMFLLKEIGQGRAKEYLSRFVDGRRAYLEKVLARDRRREYDGLDRETPTAIDRVEWFASSADLCRAMDWLRRHEGARNALSINRGGLSFEKDEWRYVGYKGGSEPGVLNLTWLLQRGDGEWLVLTLGWNDPNKPVESERLLEIAQSAVLVLQSGRRPGKAREPTSDGDHRPGR